MLFRSLIPDLGWLYLPFSVLLLTSSPAAQLLGGSDALAMQPLTSEQRLAAEAWKQADKNYVDRNFAGQDWFTTRQRMVKKTYESKEMPVLGSPVPARMAEATCVSHSEVTQNRLDVKPLRRLETLSVAKVPPECEWDTQIARSVRAGKPGGHCCVQQRPDCVCMAVECCPMERSVAGGKVFGLGQSWIIPEHFHKGVVVSFSCSYHPLLDSLIKSAD